MSNVADQSLKDIFDKIPERDQCSLLNDHGIINLSMLMNASPRLQNRELENVCTDVQFFLEIVCIYIESLESRDLFSWEGFATYCGYNDSSGENVLNYAEEVRKSRALDRYEDNDPNGLHLTAEERKQLEQLVENNPLTMKIRGFSARTLQFEEDLANKKKIVEDASEKTEVAFNGSLFYTKKCYWFQQENGECVVVAIRQFTRNEKKAIVALVIPFADTAMGPGLEEEPPIGVRKTFEEEDKSGVPLFVQVRQKPQFQPVVPLSSLKPCTEPSDMPELVYEPQQIGEPPHNFGFVYENDGTNRGAEREGLINYVDLFAGCGGSHQGLSQVPGLHGTAAVEWWDRACETLKKNDKDGTTVYCQKVEDFLEESGPTPAHFRKRHGKTDVLVCTPPCQSFSGSNRDVDHNGELDLYRKRLSLKFFDAMQLSGALIGVFENVEGIWRRPNVYFLKKIVLDHIRAGYQVRVRLHRAHVFGDPQARPRLLIYVAKKYVEMPLPIETHGPGKIPFVTVGNAFKALDKALAARQKKPELSPIANLEGSKGTKPDKESDLLRAHKPAGTIRCGGRAWHPTAERPITVREAATLQSYPYNYEFVGSLSEQYKQVGNAVPGRMARAVGMAIKESLRFVYDEEEAELAEDAAILNAPVEAGDKKMDGVQELADAATSNSDEKTEAKMQEVKDSAGEGEAMDCQESREI